MEILQLQKAQEVEKFKQEKIKTELPTLQSQCESGVEWICADNDENFKIET